MRHLLMLFWIISALTACRMVNSSSAVDSTDIPTPAPLIEPTKGISPPGPTPFADIESLLREIQQGCWQSEQQGYPIEIKEGKRYSFSCPTSAGHSAGATIEEFADASEAKAAFDKARGELAVKCFHSYPAASELHEEGSLPWYIDHHYWQAGRWLIITTSHNDTHFTQAQGFSEAIYDLAIPRQMFSPGTCGGTPTPDPNQSPYGGRPWPIPGRIEAENYDEGGPEIAYHDAGQNSGQVYRADNVAIESTSDRGGGYHITGIQNPEWLQYTVDIAETGFYKVEIRVAPDTMTNGSLSLSLEDIDIRGKTASFGRAEDGQTWTSVFIEEMYLPAGRHRLQIWMNSYDFKLNWVEFTGPVLPRIQ